MTTGSTTIDSILSNLLTELVKYVPQVLLFVAVLFFGWIASVILRRLVAWAVRATGLEAVAEKAGVSRLLYKVGLRRGFAAAMGRIVGWAVLLLTLAAAAEVAGLEGVTQALVVVVGYLPRLLVAAAILLLGVTLGQVVERVVRSYGSDRGGLDAPQIVGRAAYYAVVTVAVVLAAAQAGIETTLVDRLVTLGAALGVGAVAVSFALASRTAMGNVIAGRYLTRIAPVGSELRVDGHAGTVLRYEGTCVVLRTGPREVVAIPCSRLFEGGVRVSHPGPGTTDSADRG